MRCRWSRREVLRGATASASIGLAGCVGSLAGPSPEEQVARVSEDLQRFTDVSTAIDEGYRTTGTYVRTDDGVLGTQFINPDVQEVEPTKPQVVLYDLTNEGTYEALGLKWFVPAEGRDEPPTLFGREFDGPIDGPTAFIPRHYALHVWLFRENPEGMFALYNPAVEPSELVERISPVREALAPYLLGSEAEKKGYVNTEKCIATADGGYGVPFVREGDGDEGGTDPESPPVLLYRLTSTWSFVLMGAEWYVPTSAASAPPSLLGREFHEPMDGHSPRTDQPAHYGLHAWLFRANPRGMFVPFNPAVTC